MENSPVAFHGTRLLTLSACSTAKDYKSRNGLEMDSPGHGRSAEGCRSRAGHALGRERPQHQPHHERLLRSLGQNPAHGKAEALRQAQLAFLHGAAAAPGGGSGRGFEAVGATGASNAGLGYAHPYYWAPFVLIGNYQ